MIRRNGDFKLNTAERLTALEVKVSDIGNDLAAVKTDIKLILENHLPHLSTKVDNIGWRVGAIIGIGAMVGSALLSKLVDYVFARL